MHHCSIGQALQYLVSNSSNENLHPTHSYTLYALEM